MAYPHKWSPISYKSSAGQRKHTGQRPMLYRWTTPPTIIEADIYFWFMVFETSHVHVHVKSIAFLIRVWNSSKSVRVTALLFPQCTNQNRIRNLHMSAIRFLFRFNSPLNTKSALLNFIFVWHLVLICWKLWLPEAENYRSQNPHTSKVGKLLPVCLTNKWNNRRRCDHISEPHAIFVENR